MYQAIINVPGYLPMSDDEMFFDSIKEAWEWLAEERSRGFFDLDEAELTVTGLESILSQDQCGTVYLSTPGYDGDHDLGLAYCVVEAHDHQTEDCDHEWVSGTAIINTEDLEAIAGHGRKITCTECGLDYEVYRVK